MVAVETKPDWKMVASVYAMDAHENHIRSHRGVWFLEDLGVLCVYNNHPYAHYPDLREEEMATFRAIMEKAGIKALAHATYPAEGEGAGYSYAMILDVGQDKLDFVRYTLMDIVKESFERTK